ncbi:MAG: tetratricopeptide repeat protein [Promethearchaeota archaeon]|jgi:tetratricopeptide (TPR) repeat protein
MRISIHEELERGMFLHNEGKIEEAIQIISNFERLENVSLEDNHYFRFLKANILSSKGNFQESLKIIEEDYQEQKEQKNLLFLIDSIVVKWGALLMLYGQKGAQEVREDVIFCEKLLKSVVEEPEVEVKLRKGFILYLKGYFFLWEQKFDKSIEHLKKSQDIFEDYETGLYILSINSHGLALSYGVIGELDFALKYEKKSLNLTKGSSFMAKYMKGVIYNNIGTIYFQMGDIDRAIKYYKKSLIDLVLPPNIQTISLVGNNFEGLISALLYKGLPEEAQQSLESFSEYLEKNRMNPKNFQIFRLSKAKLLASSLRVRDRAKAEEIGKKILEEQVSSNIPDASIYIRVIMMLCDFYSQELKTTYDLEILEDIQPLVDKLLKHSERINSYSLRAHALGLSGKISLIRQNLGDARRYLTEAQQIADSHNLQLLARAISQEHDELLKQLGELERYKKKKLTLSDRLELASMDDALDVLQGRGAINAPDLIEEEPVLLLIIGEGGVLLFSYPFSDTVKIDDEIFGGFLSAFSTFSDEVLSEGLDRAKFGEYTVLMDNIGAFSFCYLFKGQTYVAQKKLANFTENFQKNTSMMDTLNQFQETSQVMELKDFPFLEGFIKGIFTAK